MNRRATEAHLQSACISWWQLQYGNTNTNWRLFKVHNEGRKSIQSAVADKRLGLMAGVFDTFLAVTTTDCPGVFIEFKAPGKHLSPPQVEFMASACSQGYQCWVIHYFDEFTVAINDYMKGIK